MYLACNAVENPSSSSCHSPDGEYLKNLCYNPLCRHWCCCRPIPGLRVRHYNTSNLRCDAEVQCENEKPTSEHVLALTRKPSHSFGSRLVVRLHHIRGGKPENSL